jgi:hypothetical protein
MRQREWKRQSQVVGQQSQNQSQSDPDQSLRLRQMQK